LTDIDSTAQASAYERAGFGARAQRGINPALIVVDFQRGFTEEAFGTGADMGAAVAAVNPLVDCVHEAGKSVIFTIISYDDSEVDAGAYPWLQKFQGGKTLRAGTPQVELDPRLHTQEHDIVIVKKGASAFVGTPLATILAAWRIDTAIVAGATTSGCVRATVADSVQYGFPTLVPREAVADRALAPHESNLYDMDQKYADVVSANDALQYLRAALLEHRT
jgi:nicotinamidase-related amidase